MMVLRRGLEYARHLFATIAGDGPAAPADARETEIVDGKYRVDALIGRGGMGAVYQARDLRLDREVAIKVVRPEILASPDAGRRFVEESQTLARLQHPGIVSVYDCGRLADGSAYLVMELVRGGDLRRELVREGRLDPDRARRILVAICSAVAAAHRENVLHCDLKPENIMLPDDGVEAKVVDFGVARALAGGERALLIPPASSVGTPAYMAPEQLRGEAVDARTDVFSLGVVACEMLTGVLPFGSGSVAEVMLAQGRGPAPMTVDGIPPPLVRAVRAAISVDPDRRPPSPQAFAHLLAAAAGMQG